MPKTLLLLTKSMAVASCIVAIAACTTTPRLTDDDVRVTFDRPSCNFERLGIVEARDGHQGHPEGQRWGPRGREAVVFAELREQAQALGADSVLVVMRRVSEREAGHGSIQIRPAKIVHMKGIAFKDCT